MTDSQSDLHTTHELYLHLRELRGKVGVMGGVGLVVPLVVGHADDAQAAGFEQAPPEPRRAARRPSDEVPGPVWNSP